MDIIRSARHATVSNAMKYKEDATFLLEFARAKKQPLIEMIPKWRPVYVKETQLARSLIPPEQRSRFTSLPESADTFMRLVGVQDPSFFSIHVLCQEILKDIETSESVQDQIASIITAKAPALASQILPLISRLRAREHSEIRAAKWIQQCHHQGDDGMPLSDSTHENVNPAASPATHIPETIPGHNEALKRRSDERSSLTDPESSNPTKKRRHGNEDLTIRHEFKTLDSPKKLEAIVNLSPLQIP